MGEAIGNGITAAVVTFLIGIVIVIAVASAKKNKAVTEAIETNRPGEHAKIVSIDKSNPYVNVVIFEFDNGSRINTTLKTSQLATLVVGDIGTLVHVDSVFVSFTRDIVA